MECGYLYKNTDSLLKRCIVLNFSHNEFVIFNCSSLVRLLVVSIMISRYAYDLDEGQRF